MPDISMLVEIAEFYEVDIREIIDGKRKSENMNDEVKVTIFYFYVEKGIEQIMRINKKTSGIKGYYYVCPRNALLRIHNSFYNFDREQ